MRLLAAWVMVCAAAHSQITVDEGSTRSHLFNGSTVVSLAIQNSLSRTIDTRIELEWIDPKGAVHQRAQLDSHTPSGKSVATVPLPLPERQDPLFLRLLYTVSPGAASLTAFVPLRGMLSFPQMADHAFRLSAVGIGTPRLGRPYEIHVLAMHPATLR